MVDTGHNAIIVDIKIVKNLGNYESIHVGASAVFIDKDPNDAKAWQDAWGVVDAEIEKKLIEIEEIDDGNKKTK